MFFSLHRVPLLIRMLDGSGRAWEALGTVHSHNSLRFSTAELTGRPSTYWEMLRRRNPNVSAVSRAMEKGAGRQHIFLSQGLRKTDAQEEMV